MAVGQVIKKCEICGQKYKSWKHCRNCKEANSWEEWANCQPGICAECYKAKMEENRASENAIIAEKAAERGMPDLHGSEKQIAWAIIIRENFYNHYSEIIETKRFTDKDKIELRKILDYAVNEFISASYWIDNRDNNTNIFNEAKTNYQQHASVPQELKKDAEAEATVAPEQLKSTTIVKIDVEGNTIKIYSDKDENLIKIFKDNGYSWSDKSWNREIGTCNGEVIDRVAEIGNKVLNSGYAVRIWDEHTRRKAIDADYIPEQTRWISYYVKGEQKGRLCIKWNGRDDEIYNAARAIKGSKYYHGAVSISIEYANLVDDFASLYGFCYTKYAEEAIAAHRDALENKVKIAEGKNDCAKSGNEKLSQVLSSNTEVIDDLKDED